MRFPILGKLAALAAVLLGLIWGLSSVNALVSERRARQLEAADGVAASSAAEQTLVGPVLRRHCVEAWEVTTGEGKERSTRTETREMVLTAIPSRLEVDGQVAIEARYRGLFKVNGYSARLKLAADWSELGALRPVAQQTDSRLRCDATQVLMAVGDARGIRAATLSLIGGAAGVHPLHAEPGTGQGDYPQGFRAVLAGEPVLDAPLKLQLALDLLGTGSLDVVPLAETTRVGLRSDWPHPSFGGQFLPGVRDVSAAGFTAEWQLSALASNAIRHYAAGKALCGRPLLSRGASENEEAPLPASAAQDCLERFGVSFIDPVNPYVLTDRATKYGLLFVALTFVAVGLVEVMRRLRVHPIQYLLVGSALVMFFLLLLSLSEHLSFAWAYGGAATACVGLLSFYASHLLRGWRAGLGFGAAMAVLYGALYLLLQMEQTALLLGTLLLFVILATLMAVTRRLDWYGLMDRLRSDPLSAPPSETTP